MEKKQPEEWELRGCETINDPEEKERYKKELEKKERQREYYKKWYEKKKAEKEGKKEKKEAKKPAAKKQEKLTLQDLTAEMIAEEETVIEEAETVIEEAEDEMPVKTMEATDVAYAEPVELKENAEAEKADLPLITAEALLEAQKKYAEDNSCYHGTDRIFSIKQPINRMEDFYLPMKLELTPSQAESLEDHLIRDIREDPEIDCMDWLADMCEIWRELKQWNTMRFSD